MTIFSLVVFNLDKNLAAQIKEAYGKAKTAKKPPPKPKSGVKKLAPPKPAPKPKPTAAPKPAVKATPVAPPKSPPVPGPSDNHYPISLGTGIAGSTRAP